jgi:hypothetical protein
MPTIPLFAWPFIDILQSSGQGGAMTRKRVIKMRIKTFIAAIAVFAGGAAWAPAPLASAAPPAAADDTKMHGVYHYADEDGGHGTWIVHTTCAPGCVAHVSTSMDSGFDAPLVDGRYTVNRSIPEGAICPDNSQHQIDVTQSWDPVTLSGEVDFLTTSAPCGLEDHRDVFTLTKVG